MRFKYKPVQIYKTLTEDTVLESGKVYRFMKPVRIKWIDWSNYVTYFHLDDEYMDKWDCHENKVVRVYNDTNTIVDFDDDYDDEFEGLPGATFALINVVSHTDDDLRYTYTPHPPFPMTGLQNAN